MYELASDSDDEKAICKARREALTSITKRKAKRREQFRNAPLYTNQTAQRDGAGRRNWGQGLRLRPNSVRSTKVAHACGKEGPFNTNVPSNSENECDLYLIKHCWEFTEGQKC